MNQMSIDPGILSPSCCYENQEKLSFLNNFFFEKWQWRKKIQF